MIKLQMTNAELNRALAEKIFNARICTRDIDSRVVIIGDFGVYDTHPLTGGWRTAIWRNTESDAWADAPDYCNDPAASLEVQAAAIEVDDLKYFESLLRPMNISIPSQPLSACTAIALATPRQRAEAAYMTLQGAQ